MNGTSLAPSRRVGHFPTPLSHPCHFYQSQLLLMTLDFSFIAFPSVSMHCHEKLVLWRSTEISAVRDLNEQCFKSV